MKNKHEILDSENVGSTNNIGDQSIVSLGKFILLSITSFGLYPFWWIYMAWRYFQHKENKDQSAPLKTIFSIVFLIPLLGKILKAAKELGYKKNYISILLYIGYFLGNIIAYLPGNFGLIAILNFVFLIPAFNALNYVKRNYADFVVVEQTGFNNRQVAIAVIGGILWIIMFAGLSME